MTRKGSSTRATGRKLAEWVTFAISALLVLAVAGYLAFEATRDDEPTVPIDVRVLSDQGSQKNNGYVIPVEVHNRGRRTLRALQLRLSYLAGDGSEQADDFTIDYLSEQAKQTVYIYLDRQPGESPITVRPVAYQLE